MCYTWKNIKKSYQNNKSKYQLQHGMKNEHYLMNHILYQMSKIILNIHSKIENRITNYNTIYLKLLPPETIKVLGITKSKITKYKNGENLRYLEITTSNISIL